MVEGLSWTLATPRAAEENTMPGPETHAKTSEANGETTALQSRAHEGRPSSRRITERSRSLVDQLHDVRGRVQHSLSLASREARAEWHTFSSRIPAREELGGERLAITEAELEEMTAKAARFSEILRQLAAGKSPREGEPRRAGPRRARRGAIHLLIG